MFRFTIRDVLWLTVVVGLAVAWYRHDRSWNQYHEDLATKAVGEANDSMERTFELRRKISALEKSQKTSPDEKSADLPNH